MTQATDNQPSKEVVREDPPDRTPRYDWQAIAKKVKRRPMEWFRVFEKDKTTITTAIRNGGITALRSDKGFEVTTSNNTRDYPRTCSLYLRYNPAKDVSNQ